jgi:chromosome partitioning protein
MKGVVVANQRGGVGKTTTAWNLAGYLSTIKQQRVLLVDADSQGSMASHLELKPKKHLSNLIIGGELLQECAVPVNDHLQVLCSNRETAQVEAALIGQIGRELAFERAFAPYANEYDWIIIDVAPSITLLQTCGMMMTGNVLVPVSMDDLSLQGAQASLEAAKVLNSLYGRSIRIIGFLPTLVNKTLLIAKITQEALEKLSGRDGIPVLPSIRIDQAVNKARRARQFVFNYDSKSRVAEDYMAAFEHVLGLLEGRNVAVEAAARS